MKRIPMVGIAEVDINSVKHIINLEHVHQIVYNTERQQAFIYIGTQTLAVPIDTGERVETEWRDCLDPLHNHK